MPTASGAIYNDVVITWKATDTWTFVTEANWIRDGFGSVGKAVNGFGAAQYASYALTDTIALNARAEIWRDDNNFFVASFPDNSDFIKFQQGLATPVVHFAPGSNTTYGGLTLGVTWKPEVPAPVTGSAGSSGSPLGSRVYRQQSFQQQSTG